MLAVIIVNHCYYYSLNYVATLPCFGYQLTAIIELLFVTSTETFKSFDHITATFASFIGIVEIENANSKVNQQGFTIAIGVTAFTCVFVAVIIANLQLDVNNLSVAEVSYLSCFRKGFITGSNLLTS